jgi:hypothetical protein
MGLSRPNEDAAPAGRHPSSADLLQTQPPAELERLRKIWKFTTGEKWENLMATFRRAQLTMDPARL